MVFVYTKIINTLIFFDPIARRIMFQSLKINKKAFTIVELMVSIVISVFLLGGIFYFMSDTIL